MTNDSASELYCIVLFIYSKNRATLPTNFQLSQLLQGKKKRYKKEKKAKTKKKVLPDGRKLQLGRLLIRVVIHNAD